VDKTQRLRYHYGVKGGENMSCQAHDSAFRTGLPPNADEKYRQAMAELRKLTDRIAAEAPWLEINVGIRTRPEFYDPAPCRSCGRQPLSGAKVAAVG